MAASKPAKRQVPRRPELWLLARHDFRQPAQSLEWLAQGLAGARSDEERQRATMLIGQVAATLQEMVAGMSLVAKLEAGETQVAGVAPLGPIVGAAVDALSAIATQRRLRLVVGQVSGVATVSAALVAAIVRGMLLYAMKHAVDGDIAVGTDATAGDVALHVTFPGTHHAKALLEGAFVDIPPLTANGRPFDGLGPALAARVAEGLGGGLGLDALSGGHARVTLALPVARA